jgi:hypothetical protein
MCWVYVNLYRNPVVQDQSRAPISVQYTLTHKCTGLSLNVGKNDLKVVCNEKKRDVSKMAVDCTE